MAALAALIPMLTPAIGVGGSSAIAGAAAGGSSIFGSLGTLLGAGGTILGGINAKRSADFEAAQAKAKGDAAVASAQRKALWDKQQGDLMISRQRAIAAADGGGGSNTDSVGAIMAKTKQQSDYNAGMDMYNGITARDDLYTQASSTKASGSSALMGSFINAGTGIFKDYARRARMASYSNAYDIGYGF